MPSQGTLGLHLIPSLQTPHTAPPIKAIEVLLLLLLLVLLFLLLLVLLLLLLLLLARCLFCM